MDELTDRQMRDKVIKDSHMLVLSKVQSGEELNWLELNVLRALLEKRIGISSEVAELVKSLLLSGLIKEI